jgi:hypothetical protein
LGGEEDECFYDFLSEYFEERPYSAIEQKTLTLFVSWYGLLGLKEFRKLFEFVRLVNIIRL